ncbi:MAG: hypothetical protein K0S41_1240 [Anaerocolumna sp.]|jgi:subtilisin family serine protease|nr:hypothetical protein [Anaerocolumna sp.]
MDDHCIERITSNDYADFLTDYSRNLEVLRNDPNICLDIIDENIAIVYVHQNLVLPNAVQVYGYNVFPRCFGLLDTKSVEASGVTKLRNIPTLNLQGHGVLIGIIDTGIDYTHNAFKNIDGTSKILSMWDQTIQSGPPPKDFLFGTEYTKDQINEALLSDNPMSIVPSMDEIGHGTFLAGIAAGSISQENGFSGVSPGAQLAVVKLKPAKPYLKEFLAIPPDAICFQENDIILGAKYLVSVASRLQRPLALCIGLGTSQGAHDESGFLSSYLSTIARKNLVAVVIAGGNEGNSGHHYYGVFKNDDKYKTVDLKVGPNVYGFTMDLWGSAPSSFSIDILSPTGELIEKIPARIGESRKLKFQDEKTIIKIDYLFVEAQTGSPLILMRFHNPTEGIWRFNIYNNLGFDSDFNIWLPVTSFLDNQTYFLEANPYTTMTHPANTIIPIKVTAYDPSDRSLYIDASKGFTRNNFVSPDITAPGVNIIGPALNNGYITKSGTSIAAAHVAGIAAILLEWGYVRGNFTRINSVEIKNFIIRGAIRDTSITYPSREWGYGILDIYNSLLNLYDD